MGIPEANFAILMDVNAGEFLHIRMGQKKCRGKFVHKLTVAAEIDVGHVL